MTAHEPESAQAPKRGSGHAEPTSRIAVLVVEDNRVLRDGIVNILRRHRDLEVAVAAGADTALRHMAKAPPPPPVVVVDASLADHDPPSLVQRIRQTDPGTRVIVMDLVPGPEDVVEFVKAGACGFVMKDASVEVFVRTIRLVATGRVVLPAALTETLFSHIAQRTAHRSLRKELRSVRLTAREREIIAMIGEGLSNKEIAQRIHLSPHTVKSHVHNILDKLALHSRLQVAAYVHEADRESE